MGSSLLSGSRSLLALGAVGAMLGCSDPQATDDERLGQTSSALFGNDQTSFDYFVGKGLTAVQAAGIVGNLDQESGDSPTAVQSPGAGRGVAQWSAGGRWDTDSGDNENWYVTNEDGGSSGIWELGPQLDFIWFELTTFPSYGLADLQSQTTVDGATLSFMTNFEGCGQCDASTRETYAQNVYDAYADFPYAAAFVAQSFPLATTTLTMKVGQVIPSFIELKNTGEKTWDANTKIGTTEPRDRTSVFADATWLAPNRPAGVKGTVAPGATYKFTFDLAAPKTPGTYDEHFGVVQDGVAWFSDPGQGGPPDTDLEVKIQVVSGAASGSGTASAGTGGASAMGTGGAGGSSGSETSSSGEPSSSNASNAATSSSGAGTPEETSNKSSGCAAASSRGASDGAVWGIGLAIAGTRLKRLKRRRRA